MEKKFLLTLDNEFIEYCRVNNIQDVEKFGKELFQKAFTELKYRQHFPTTTPLPRPIVNKVVKEPEDLKRIRERVETTTLAEEINNKNNLYDE